MGKLSMKLKIVINYLKNLKKSKLHFDKDICNAARYKEKSMILIKREHFLKKKLTEFIGKPKRY